MQKGQECAIDAAATDTNPAFRHFLLDEPVASEKMRQTFRTVPRVA